MPKSLIVYFSQGGTTVHIAESIAEGLRAANHDVHIHNIKDGQPPDPRNYDILGIGSPTYYFRPPFNVIEYLNGLPDLVGKSFFVFVLHGTYSGDTGNIIRRTLERKGAREIGYSRCLGADYFLGISSGGISFRRIILRPRKSLRLKYSGERLPRIMRASPMSNRNMTPRLP